MESHDPFFNLAIEELLLKNRKVEYLILGFNSPSLIIGKHQSPYREINTKYATKNKIPVIRRISGGGTVFHDMGNLNFTFITNSEPGKQIDFRKHTLPVIGFLSSLGVEATFEGKNDLKVNGLKISGNAEHIYHNRVLHHGTLLFDTSPDMMRNSLRKDDSCYITRAVASNPSSVTNLKDRLKVFKNIYQFRSEMMNYFLKNLSEAAPCQLTEPESREADQLADSKYRSWEWNWAYGPEYQFVNKFESGGRQIICRLFVRDGTIRECQLEGSPEITVAGKKLIGCRHMVEDLTEILKKEITTITDEEIYNFF
jgi:lipoate-protein ligase A